MAKPIKTRHLTIYLIKEEFTDPASVLSAKAGAHSRQVQVGGKTLGTLYVKTGFVHPPGWKSFFDGACAWGGLDLISASTSATWLLPVDSRTFAITFGHGRHLLEPGATEENFGLRVTLNSISSDRIRSIDRQSFDAISRHTRQQGSREGAMSDFGMDVEDDVLRAVTGTPTDATLGKRLSGMDALITQLAIAPGDVPAQLRRYLTLFHDQGYRERFPWVDQVRDIRDKTLLHLLDDRLVKDLQAGDRDRMWLAVPEIIDWTNVEGFAYGETASPVVEDEDLHLERLVEGVEAKAMTIQLLKGTKLLCLDRADHNVLKSWTAYQCLYAEVDYQKKSYLLNNGKWYEVHPDYYRESLAELSRIPASTLPFPPYADKGEGDYNARVASSDPARFALMDAKNLPYPKGRSRFEFCDLYTSGKELVHVKRYGGSAPLSHLCAQAVNSARLVLERDFREKVAAKLPATHLLPVDDVDFHRGEYEIVLAIVSRSKKPLVLPFFGLMNVINARRQLTAYGFKTSLAKIAHA